MLENNQNKNLVLIEDLGMMFATKTSKEKRRFGLYKCFCGNEFKTMTDNVKSGRTKSCGCHKKKVSAENGRNASTHGCSNHKLYSVWHSMICRCYKKTNSRYYSHGARGIIVCNRWLKVENFIEDMSLTYKQGLSLDREDNDGNYEPSNCRWVSMTTQAQNTRILRSTNTSGFRGVTKKKENNKFRARIEVATKSIHLGYFETALEAAKVYDKYILDNNLEHTRNFN